MHHTIQLSYAREPILWFCISITNAWLLQTDIFFQKFEGVYNEQVARGPPSAKAQFEYAWCLVRSRNKHDLRKGVALLEGILFRKSTISHLVATQHKHKQRHSALAMAFFLFRSLPENHGWDCKERLLVLLFSGKLTIRGENEVPLQQSTIGLQYTVHKSPIKHKSWCTLKVSQL